MKSPPLSPRQSEILRLIARGKSDREIASDLKISSSTVKTHVKLMLAKLKARSRAHAVSLSFCR